MILCDHPQKVEKLFQGWQETMIYSYLQGCMGKCYVDNIENPTSAQIMIADFSFFAGKPCEDLVKNIDCEFVIMVPQNDDWSYLIERVYGIKAVQRERYATLKQKDIFDQAYLQSLVTQLNQKYDMKMIDEECYNEIMSSSCHPFHDLCGQFATYDEYYQHGLGVVIMNGEEMIAGASSYTYYQEGIEIEIDTLPKYRNQGLATVCGAQLILECLKKNLYPSWDAKNQISLRLSRKLGYQFDHSYFVYEMMKEVFI